MRGGAALELRNQLHTLDVFARLPVLLVAKVNRRVLVVLARLEIVLVLSRNIGGHEVDRERHDASVMI